MTSRVDLQARAGATICTDAERECVTFFAAGIAKPKGSHRAFIAGGRAVIAPASTGEKGWRQVVNSAAHDAMNGRAPFEGCLTVLMEFYELRPRGHYRQNGQLKHDVQPAPRKAPDWDKLARSVGDALNGVVWRDDSQVCDGRVTKRYTDDDNATVGVRVTVARYIAR